ncbi:hypothetical protein AYI68_g7132, partial [Smittium mucronatum]
MESTCCITEFY